MILVSIITPSYNTGKFIAETINSVISQTYTQWEMIIVDDCSSDNSIDIIKSFDDERIILLQNEKNSGAAVSRNKALMEAKGKMIAFLDSDDIWTADKLERQVSFMKTNGYAFSYHNYELIDESSELMGTKLIGPRKYGRCGVFLFNWVGTLSVMYDRDVVGLIQIPDIKKRNDYLMWILAAQKTDCYLLPETLGYYRVRKDSISRVRRRVLLKSHYIMFRTGLGRGIIFSLFMTFINVVCKTLYKDLRYRKWYPVERGRKWQANKIK